MGYKPTLGGLEKAREFLSLRGNPMPICVVAIYDDEYSDEKLLELPWNEAIRRYGPMREVVDAFLENEQHNEFVRFRGDRFIYRLAFSDLELREVVKGGWDACVRFRKGDDPVDYRGNFMNSEDGSVFVNLARWGKAIPTMLDRIKFRLFPKRYAREVFA